MSDPVCVGTTYRTWTIWLPALAGSAFLVAGGFAWSISDSSSCFLFGIGIVFLPVAVVAVCRAAIGRLWLEDLGTGFTLSGPGREQEYADSDVQSLAWWTRNDYSSGLLKAVTSHVRLRVTGPNGTETLALRSRVPLGETDPLAGMIERLLDRFHEGANRAIQQGKEVHGMGWELTRTGLNLRHGKAEFHYPLESITAVSFIDKHVCIWQERDKQPKAKIPDTSENAHVLLRLLRERLMDQVARKPTPPDNSLGRVLFERGKQGPRLFIGFGIGFLLLGIVLLWAATAIGWLFLLGGSLFFPLAWVHRRDSFCCHEYGVCVRSWRGENRLRYEDVETFTYSAVRIILNGVYTGTTIKLSFQPFPDQGGKAIAFETSVRGADEELDQLRDHISNIIANQLLQELNAGQPVSWTPSLQLLPKGIKYLPHSKWGRKQWVFCPITDIQGFDIQEGVFYLWAHGKSKPVMEEKTIVPNFFPGYKVLQSYFSSPERADP